MTTLEFGAWAALRPAVIDERYGGVAADAYEADIRQARLLDELGLILIDARGFGDYGCWTALKRATN